LLLALAWNWIRKKQETAAWALLGVCVLTLSVRSMVRNRDWKDGLSLYSSAVRAVPNDSKMHANLAGQYFLRNQFDLAVKEYQAALRINPNSPETLSACSVLEYQRGNYQSAGRMMETALGMSGRNNINYDYMVVKFAAILMKTNHADGAQEYLDREITEAPVYAPAWSMRAEFHYQQGQPKEARADAEAALSLDPSDAQAQNVLHRLDASSPSEVQR
jgi:tetratricopeptide (TPR) repeat protein